MRREKKRQKEKKERMGEKERNKQIKLGHFGQKQHNFFSKKKKIQKSLT